MHTIFSRIIKTSCFVLLTGISAYSQGNPWLLTGNSVGATDYMGSNNAVPVYFRTNASAGNPTQGQALLTTEGSFMVESGNNTNTSTAKGSLVVGLSNTLGADAGSSLVSGWENDLSAAGGANTVVGQRNTVNNNASKSVALGAANFIRNHNQFAIGVGVDLTKEYSGGFGVDLAATENRSFVFGSGTAAAKLTNNIQSSIMFGLSSTPTMLIKDQQVGIGTTAPTAVLHTVGSVKHAGLPSGTGNILVIDSDGNLMVSGSSAMVKGDDGVESALQQQIDGLTQQIVELRSLLLKQGGQSSNTMDVPRLLQNAPNPSGGATTIGYYLPETASSGFINIYDTKGQLIQNFPLRNKGNNNITINSSELRPGAYFYNMVIDGKLVDSKNMVVGSN